MKLIFSIAAASAIALSVTAFAQTSPFTGVYISAAGGYSDLAHDFNTSGLTFDADGTVSASSSREISITQNAYIGSFGLGYGYQFMNQLYLGAELGYDVYSDYAEEHSQNNLLSPDGDATSISARLSRQYRLSVIFGKVVANQVLLYAKLSGLYGRYSTSIEDVGILTDTSMELDHNAWLYGGELGAGLAWQLVGGLSLTAEYDYLKYENEIYTTRKDRPAGRHSDLNVKNSLSGSQFLLGLTYRF